MSTDATGATPKPSIGKRIGHYALIAAPVLFLIAVIAIAIALWATAQPSYYSKFHGFDRRFTKLEESTHADISCVECHGATGVKGLAQRVGDFYGSIVGTTAQPAFTVFGPPTNAACMQCHKDDWSDDASRTALVPHPAHLRVADETRDCVGCHRWISHEEAYQAKHKTMPFSGVCAALACHVGTKQRPSCGTCHHALVVDRTKWTAEHKDIVNKVGPNACLESCHKEQQCSTCHTTGKAVDLPAYVPNTQVQFGDMHTKPDWLSKHGPIALADPKACTTCHVSNGECIDCHANRPAFHGPKSTWLNKHKEIAKSVDDAGCLTCHQKTWCEDCHAQFKEKR